MHTLVKLERRSYVSRAVGTLAICFVFCPFLTRLSAVNLRIDDFSVLPTNHVTSIMVRVWPAPSAQIITLKFLTITGTAEAVFLPGGQTETNITESSILSAIGVEPSCIDDNMVLEVSINESVMATNTFTVIDNQVAAEEIEKVKADGEKMLTKPQAIAIAREAIKGRVKLQEGVPITVELKDQNYIVTFGYIRPDLKTHPGWRGPAFTARVTLNAYTGEVERGIQRGS